MWLGVGLLLWRGLLLKFFIIYSSQSAVESHPSACGKWNLSPWDHLSRAASDISFLEGGETRRRNPALLQCRSHGVVSVFFFLFCAQRFFRFFPFPPLLPSLGWLLLPPALPAGLRVLKSPAGFFFFFFFGGGCQITERGERKKTSTSYGIRVLRWLCVCVCVCVCARKTASPSVQREGEGGERRALTWQVDCGHSLKRVWFVTAPDRLWKEFLSQLWISISGGMREWWLWQCDDNKALIQFLDVFFFFFFLTDQTKHSSLIETSMWPFFLCKVVIISSYSQDAFTTRIRV